VVKCRIDIQDKEKRLKIIRKTAENITAKIYYKNSILFYKNIREITNKL